ncbi:hypothetical protein Barb6XT_02654 [Bacteroidales bacterium Barb6XT]|nr:hypothetical protein Barb6XT_02654 [Bacteroidales bacterium Barb6XT]
MQRGSKTDEILTLVFMLLAIAAAVCWFAADGKLPFLCCGGTAVAVRIVQHIARIF